MELEDIIRNYIENPNGNQPMFLPHPVTINGVEFPKGCPMFPATEHDLPGIVGHVMIHEWLGTAPVTIWDLMGK